jgi:hypothetical protein
MPRILVAMRAFVAILAIGLGLPSQSMPLFEEDGILDVELRGPLGSVLQNVRRRDEHPFTLVVEGRTLALKAGLRGRSRVDLCPFPPLRLNFPGSGTAGTAFEGQDKLKLVTHCKARSTRAENNVLDEYAAYRIFNLISARSYRVRLLRISYVDTDGRASDLDRAYYGFLIESDEELADRLRAARVKVDGVLYSRLEPMQTARMNVFQYLIGNSDWSFIKDADEDGCCHNIDLFTIGDQLVPVPYDFDQSGIVDARYAAPSPGSRARSVTVREYAGYCRSPLEVVGRALDEILALEADILSVSENLPNVRESLTERRVKYVEQFFDEARDRDGLVGEFDRHCVGRRS